MELLNPCADVKRQLLAIAFDNSTKGIIQEFLVSPKDRMMAELLRDIDIPQKMMRMAADLTLVAKSTNPCRLCECCPKNLAAGEKIFITYFDRETGKRYTDEAHPECTKYNKECYHDNI